MEELTNIEKQLGNGLTPHDLCRVPGDSLRPLFTDEW